jgi:Flp pilus assembly secretin CpaC
MFRSTTALFLSLLISQIAHAEDSVVPPYSAPAGNLPNQIVSTNSRSVDPAKSALLKQKLNDLANLQQEIRQLRTETGTQQQIVVRVQMLEFSLTKMRKMGFEFPGLGSGYLTGRDLAQLLAKAKTGAPYSKTANKSSQNDAPSIVEWMKATNIGRVLAEPTVVVVDGRPASLHLGNDIHLPASDKSKAIEYRPIGTQLDVLASCLGQDRVRMEIRASVSDADYSNGFPFNGGTLPRINVRQFCSSIESGFGEAGVLTGTIERRTEAIKTTFGVHDETNEICLMLIVTPERADAPQMAERPAGYTMPK